PRVAFQGRCSRRALLLQHHGESVGAGEACLPAHSGCGTSDKPDAGLPLPRKHDARGQCPAGSDSGWPLGPLPRLDGPRSTCIALQ
ncbi:ACHE, partial [Symbiodinium sp. CCMP2456]